MKIIRLGMRGMELCLIVVGVILFLAKIHGMNIYVVLSGSMEPVIETGSVVFVDTKRKDYEIGDIITYEIDDQLVTHRIVEINDCIYKTKGDANEHPDSVMVEYSKILGRVRYVVPKAGYFIFYMKSKKLFLWMIILIVLVYLFDVLSESNSPKSKI